jgi:membrane-associated phospholipid phosphatase
MVAHIPLIPTRAKRAFVGASMLAALFVVVWFAVFHITRIAQWDSDIYFGFRGLHTHPLLNKLALFWADLCNPSPYVYLAAVPVALAIWRRRPAVAVAILVILAGANETTHLLKPVLASTKPVHTAFQPLPGSFPSGHSTAAMTLALCAVIASPVRWRRYVAILGAVFAIGVMYSVVTLGWHYPSDTLGGLLVASIWTLGGMGLLFTIEGRKQRTGATSVLNTTRLGLGHELAPVGMGVIGAIGVLVLVVLARPNAVIAYAAAHTAFVAGAAGLACLSVLVATAVMVTLRR